MREKRRLKLWVKAVLVVLALSVIVAILGIVVRAGKGSENNNKQIEYGEILQVEIDGDGK